MRAAMPHSLLELAVAVPTVVLLGPIAEELYFRGALLSWIRDKAGLFAGMIVASVLFALAHGQFAANPGPQGWIMTGLLAVVGFVAAVLAWRSGSLWPPFVMHAAFNGTMIAFAFLAPETRA
jgi:membrane protease YdiL (CAAX protease family)